MAKRVAKKSTPRKNAAESIVAEAQAAVFGPAPEGFASKHKFARRDLAKQLRAIDWFAECGQPGEFDLTMPVEQVKSWARATKAIKSRAWGNATLEARNQLTGTLSKYHRERYRDWNKITDKLKRESVTPLSTKVWKPYFERHELDVKFVFSNQWVVLAALMEDAFRDCRHGCFFFHELLTIFTAGHIPCGWTGVWPKGKLVIY